LASSFGLSLPEDPSEKLLALLAIIIVWLLVLGGNPSANAETNGRFVLTSRVSPPQGRTATARSGEFGVLRRIASGMGVDPWFW
jgi:hypothetical protein